MDLDALQTWVDQIALALSPSERRSLMRILSQGLRVRMRERIKKQQDPDGYKFIPRKRDQIGRIRRQGAMFQRLGRHIKTEYSADHAAVGFAGRTGEIMQTHQDGLIDQPSRHARPTAYPQRKTTGFSQDDERWIESTILKFVGSRIG